MQTSARICGVVAVVFAAADWGSWAGISPTSQVRSLATEASAELPAVPPNPVLDSDLSSAPDFSSYLAEVQSEATDFAAPPFALRYGQGTAKQDSKIGPIIISAKGEASVQLNLIPGNILGGASRAEAESLFDVTFSIDVRSHFSLTGLLDTQGITAGGATVPNLDNDFSFWDLDASTLLFNAASTDESIALSGVLEPGQYRLLANAVVSAAEVSVLGPSRSVSGLSSFDLRLIVTNVPESNSVLAWIGLCGLVGGTWLTRHLKG